MNHFEAHLIVSSREVDSKVFGMVIRFEYLLIKRQHGELMLEVLDGFSLV